MHFPVIQRTFCIAWASSDGIHLKGPIVRYDRTDVRILEIVQKDNRLTFEAIGELAGLSVTACQRRLKRLRSDGIVQAYISIVSPNAAGRPVQVLALVIPDLPASRLHELLPWLLQATKPADQQAA